MNLNLMKRKVTTLISTGAILAMAATISASAAEDDPPLALARDGFFYVGGKNTTINGHTYVVGQMYVEMRIPAKQTHRFPIIMVHGGTRTGTTYTGTPDGRESWAQYFARRGYAVYVVDQPGRGRSGYLTEAYGPQNLADGESGQRRYLQQEKFKLWPQADLHTQWPGNGAPDWFKEGAVALPYGVSAVPLTYAPAVKDASELSFVKEAKADAPDLVTCWKQAEPARQLTKLKMPIMVLTSEASYHAPYDHCTVKFLEQAGVRPSFIRLADLGIKGNSHVLMLEKNNKDIASVIAGWLDKTFKE